MRFELLKPTDARWAALLATTPHDVYHLPGYGPLNERSLHAEERALFAQGERGAFLLPLMLRPLPELGERDLRSWRDATSGYGYPGPLLRGDFSDAERTHFAAACLDYLASERVLTCFVRCNPMLPDADAVLAPLGQEVVHGDVALVDLTAGEEAIWKNFEQTHRRHILRLRRRGYTTRIDHWADLDGFKALYRDTMGRVGASAFYLFDDAYFDGLRALLGDALHIGAVFDGEGTLVSAGLFTHCGGRVNAHLSSSARSHLQWAPSKLLFDITWRWSLEAGAKVVNIGGGVGGAKDSLFRFKQGFANALKPFRTVRLVSDPGLYAVACACVGNDGQALDGFFPGYRQPPKAVTRPMSATG
jgi:hypothetical protein